ncbi:MAG: sigma-54 dependent transcriptional regulator [Desulfobacterales bacterium]|jgi:DNA-binding NtrC family response regulator|nr:sigma-54 dependent transcriptional regulator [Desulfobacterales bacterium]
MGSRIIVVDDDGDYLDLVISRLKAGGFPETVGLNDPIAAAECFESNGAFDVALIDVGMPELDGRELLETIKRHSPWTECIMVTAVNDARTAVECLRLGAYDYLVKPVSEEDLIFAVKRALERKRLLDILQIERSRRPPVFEQPEAFREIITRSTSLLRVLKEAELHAASDVPILITGASGTGKELLARAIHRASPRRRQPFLPVNMAALTGGLFEAEFFGHTKGAFTGAERERPGHIRHCDHGTLFLDEIGNLPLGLQGKLLRVLQDGEFTPVGSSAPQRADVRFVAATNEDLDQMVAGHRFRRDLYYRIRGSWLHLPPLKERREDIPVLIEHFLKNLGKADPGQSMDAAALDVLMAYEYPGNVRELKSILQAAVNLSQGRKLSIDCLPEPLRRRDLPAGGSRSRRRSPRRPLADVEKQHILDVYNDLDRNKVRAARVLGVGLNTLRRKLKAYGVE